MKRFDVNEKSVVLVLSKMQAKALYDRTRQHTGIRKSKILLLQKERS
jgi:hypothetical protein